MSLGSKAILWPFSLLVYDVSGRRLSSAEPFLDMGEDTLLSSFSSPPATRPPPLRRVKPPAEAMRMKVRDVFGEYELDQEGEFRWNQKFVSLEKSP